MSTELSPHAAESLDLRRERYRRAAELLRNWTLQDSGYDESVGRVLEEESSELRMRCGNENESDT